MIVAERHLSCEQDGCAIDVPILLFGPEQGEYGWKCEYSIGWPDEEYRSAIWGVDAVQALWLTLQTIGSEIYRSDYHRAGQLRWKEAGQGYGFPVAHILRDQLVGDDARFDGR